MIEMNGKKVRDELLQEYKNIIEKESLKITLAIIQIGHNESSNLYIKNKIKYANEIGIEVESIVLEETITEQEVIKEIETLNQNPNITGILLQAPVPNHISFENCIQKIHYRKDVEGLTSENIYRRYENQEAIIPCTAKGIMKLLEYYNIPLVGKNITIIGRSDLIGKPLIHLLLKEDATITVCHSKTKNIKEHTQNADIVISGVGKPNLIIKDMVKDNYVGIDAGITTNNEKVVGDFAKDVKEKASYYTPVPGGVGPMTIAMLMENLIQLKRKQIEERER